MYEYIYIYIYIYIRMWPVELLSVEGRTEGGTADHLLAHHMLFAFVRILVIPTARITASIHRPLSIQMSVALHSPVSSHHQPAGSSRGS